MKGVEELIKSLAVQQQLTTLDLSNNRIGLNGAKGLADVLSEPTCQIATLSLAGNRLGDAASIALAGALLCSRGLTNVNLRDCAIRDAGACSLSDYFAINQRIETLDLSWNHIRSRGGVALANCLSQNPALTDFDLSWNGIGQLVDGMRQPGAEEIGGAIAANTNLLRLDLSHNRIEVPGAFVIADGMDRNKTITQLVMDGNPIGQAGGRELLRAIRELGDLRDISLKDCNIKGTDQKMMNFDPSAPSGPYRLNLNAKYDRAIAAQLIKVIKGSGGRDRWCEVGIALRFRGLPSPICPAKQGQCRGTKAPYICMCMRPLYWSPNNSQFKDETKPDDWAASTLKPGDCKLDEKTVKRAIGAENDKSECDIPEICALVEGLMNGGHTAACKNCDDSAVNEPCKLCNGWNASWGPLKTWLDDGAILHDSCVLTFNHEHAQRPATEDDVVSTAALSKLKAIIRDTREGGTERPADSRQGQAQAAALKAKESTKKLQMRVAMIKNKHAEYSEGGSKFGGMDMMKLIKLAKEAKDVEEQFRAEKEASEKLQEAAERLQSSGTTEAEKKQQRAILDMSAKEFYFKADQVEDLLGLFTDERAKAEAVIKLFERVLDTEALLEMVEDKLGNEERNLIEKRLGPLYRFDAKNPSGHYRLDLARPFDRLLANKMVEASNGENEEREQSGLVDTSQRLNHYNFRNQKLGGKTNNRKFGAQGLEIPKEGIFEFDYTSTFLDGKPR